MENTNEPIGLLEREAYVRCHWSTAKKQFFAKSSFVANDCGYELWEKRVPPIKITFFGEDGHPESKQ